MTHSLDGIRAKIQRTDEHIENLKADITAFIDLNVYRATTHPQRDTPECIISVAGPDPPLRFAVIVGEIVHHLRSALDHLVWQLVLANGQTPNKSNQFPICETLQQYKSALGRGYIDGVSSPAKSLIKSLQPYHKGKNCQWEGLWILNDLSNTDKHRLLLVVPAIVTPKVFGVSSSEANPLTITGMKPSDWPARATKDGTEVMRFTFTAPNPDVKMNVDFTVEIAFEKFGPLSNARLIPQINNLRDIIVGIIDRFHPFVR